MINTCVCTHLCVLIRSLDTPKGACRAVSSVGQSATLTSLRIRYVYLVFKPVFIKTLYKKTVCYGMRLLICAHLCALTACASSSYDTANLAIKLKNQTTPDIWYQEVIKPHRDKFNILEKGQDDE